MVGSTLNSKDAPTGVASLPQGGPEQWNADTASLPDLYAETAPAHGSCLNCLSEFVFPHVEQLPGFYDPFTRQFAYGSVGVQAYRLGWFSYDDFVFMPRARASVGGEFQNVEWNTWLRYSRVVNESMVFAWNAGLNGHFWTGPTGIALPADGDQLVSDFQLSSFWNGPWNWQIGVTPQINSDFTRALNSNSFMVDARAVLLYRPVAEWMLAIGAAFWNRASDHLIPYGGVIWAPNDRWELRLMFPRSRISYYIGNICGFETWGYISGEYAPLIWLEMRSSAFRDVLESYIGLWGPQQSAAMPAPPTKGS